MLRRLSVALLALGSGLAVAAGLLAYEGAGRPGTEVYAASGDIQAGSPLRGGSVHLVRAALDSRQAALAYRPGEEARLAASVASHDLAAGQIVQRSDTAADARSLDRALVLVPLRDAPPLRAGDHIDLLFVTGSGDAVQVNLFAPSLEVYSVEAGGVVLLVGSAQAPGFVYAAAALRLVAVAVSPGPRRDEEVAVSSAQQARALARR